MRKELTAERARELLDYNPVTGKFTRKDNIEWLPAARGHHLGKGPKHKDQGKGKRTGYTRVYIDGTSYKAHRLAWLIQTGKWPKNSIDHLDGDGSNNAFANLREASAGENHRNRPRYVTNKSGKSGVYWRENLKKWVVQINAEKGVQKYLGCFDTLEEAVAAREQAERELGYHQNHGRVKNPGE
jgi:hypothetical protein